MRSREVRAIPVPNRPKPPRAAHRGTPGLLPVDPMTPVTSHVGALPRRDKTPIGRPYTRARSYFPSLVDLRADTCRSHRRRQGEPMHRRLITPLTVALTLLVAVAGAQSPTTTEKKPLDVPYVPTHESLVDEMLSMARVGANDVLYDLGSGDGRIVITAAKKFG